jgi:hypothetical protein
MSRSSYSSLPSSPDRALWTVHVIKVRAVLFSPFPCYSIFGPNIRLSNEFSEVLYRCLSLSLTEEVLTSTWNMDESYVYLHRLHYSYHSKSFSEPRTILLSQLEKKVSWSPQIADAQSQCTITPINITLIWSSFSPTHKKDEDGYALLSIQVTVRIVVTWLITFGMAKSTIGIMSQVRKRGKIGLNQSLLHIHPFPLISPQIFYLPLFNSVAKTLF